MKTYQEANQHVRIYLFFFKFRVQLLIVLEYIWKKKYEIAKRLELVSDDKHIR